MGMNKTELIREVSRISGIESSDCIKVMDALEQALSQELESSQSVRNAFDKIHGLMSILRNK